MFNKILKGAAISCLAFALFSQSVFAITAPTLWKKVGTDVNLVNDTWTLEVANLTVTGTFTFGGVMGSDLDMAGYYLEDSTAGILKLRSTLAAGNNEDALFDFETTANEVGIGTSTGVDTWDFGPIKLIAGSLDLAGSTVVSSTIDDDTMGTASDTSLATSESIKAYTDSVVAGFAPVGATYITQTTDATLTNEQAMSSLTTGIVKNATTTGIQSIAVDGTDYISSVVVDTTPQLGGDLDLNSKNLDFPTTSDISDVLDEDAMGSDSATKLATQQSIKAYVDNKVVDASNVEMSEYGTATYDDVQDWANTTQSSGKITGGAFTDGGSGTLNISAGTGYIRATNSEVAEVLHFDWSQKTALGLTDNNSNYIYIDYDSGNMTIKATTTKTDANNRDNILLGKVYRSGTDLHMVEAGMVITEPAKRVLAYLTSIHGEVVRASGLSISEKATRGFELTAGVMFAGLTPVAIVPYDSTATNFTYWYNDGAWQSSATGAIDKLNYNDYGTGLDTLTSNRYGVHWVYTHDDGDVDVVYGIGDYTLSGAQAAQPLANLPNIVSDFTTFTGKIIIKQNTDTFYSIESAFDTTFVGSTSTDHGSLGGLDHDDHLQYGALSGRAGGQVYIGGTGSGDDITFQTTSDGSKGSYIFTELSTANGLMTTDGSGVVTSTLTPSGLTSVTATSFVGALTGQADTVATITGLAPDTATTAAAQTSITSLGTLTSLTVSGAMLASGATSLTLGTASANTGGIVLHNATNANTTTINSGVAGASITFTLPVDDGDNEDVLQTDGSGVLSWVASGGGGGLTGDTTKTIGATGDYSDLSEAYAAESTPYNFLLVSDVTEDSDIAIDGVTVLDLSHFELAVGDWQFTYAATADVFVKGDGVESGAELSWGQSDGEELFNNTSYTTSILKVDNIVMDCNNAGADGNYVSGAIERISNVRYEAPNLGATNFRPTHLYPSYYENIVIKGGGSSAKNFIYLLAPDSWLNNIQVDATIGSTSFSLKLHGDQTKGTNILFNDEGRIEISGDYTILDNVTTGTQGVDISIEGDHVAVSNVNTIDDLSFSTTLYSKFSNIRVDGTFSGAIGSYNSFVNVRYEGSTNTTFTAVSDQNMFTNCYFDEDVIIQSGSDDNSFVNCQVGAVGGGGADTFTIDSGSNRTIIGSSKTDDTISDAGTGSAIANNTVY